VVVDPNLKVPYYQQFNLGIERQVKRIVFDVRYLGNHGTRMLQGLNENQINIDAGGFLQDFINAQSNGNLSQAAGLGFQPQYNPAVSGSKPLPVFNQLPLGGLIAQAPFVNYIQQGQAGTLAFLYQLIGLNGPINFYRNPNELIGGFTTNYANSTYNSLQAETRGKLTKDLQFQFSYVFGKVMTDSTGAPTQGNVEPLLVSNNGRLERGRASFDLTHVFKANYIYQVPLRAGHRFLGTGVLERIFGGWSTSAFIIRQSGNPFTILDPIGTYNFVDTTQTAVINGITKSQLDAVTGNRTYVNGNGVYLVNPSIISSAGQGVAPFGSPAYKGQIFFNPGPGQIGNLQQNEFSGPWATNMNASVQKTFKVFERQTLQIRADFDNLFNHAVFEPQSGLSVQSTTFGKVTSDLYGPRLIQFGVHYRF
jgi:hypothetical protein